MDTSSNKNVIWFILFSSMSDGNTSATKRGELETNSDQQTNISEVEKAPDLNGIKYDYDRLTTELKDHEKFKNHIIEGSYLLSSKIEPYHKKSDILKNLAEFFDNKNAKSSVLFLSGHGGVCNIKTGKIYLVLETENGDEKLYYEEIREIWRKRSSEKTNNFLLIIIDACHSGGWVKENYDNLDFKDIFIQARCLLPQVSLDIKNQGGVYCITS